VRVVINFYTPQTGWYIPLPALDSPQTLILVFGEPDFQRYQTALTELQTRYHQAIIAGCSALSGIFNDRVVENVLLVGIIQFEHTRLAMTTAHLNHIEDSWRAGRHIATTLQTPDLKGLLLFTDGLNTHSAELLAGVASGIDQQRVTVVGGLASDKMQFNLTWVLYQGNIQSHLACGIGFYGERIVFRNYAKDGFKPFGPERMITRADKHILYEIDHIPALKLYKEYLGDNADKLPGIALNYPLAVWEKDKQHYVVRVPIDIDEENQSLTFIADIPSGYCTQLMYGTFDNLIEGAEEAAMHLTKDIPINTPVFALAISCAARKLVLAEDTVQELEATLQNLPAGSQQLGFYSYGELARTSHDGNCNLHNETMTLTVIYEGN
jgi:hypothetical protein